MAFTILVALSAASVLFSTPVNAGLYPKSSAVLSITGKTYNSLIANSNHTSIVEFYAPWCGHCKNLQPAYEKVAQNLKGLAKVAAIDCDEETNKPFCGSMGVQGFPTIKIIRPGKKPGRPTVEDYQGPRQAKAIVDAVVEKIPNHVKRVTDKSVDSWLKESNETAKAILFSDKSNISPLLKSLAIDFLGGITFGQVRDKESETISTFGITKYPTLILLPGGSQDAVTYTGDLKKEAMSAFLSSTSGISPNPDPAPSAPKKSPSQKSDKKKDKKFSASSASHKSADASSEKLKATSASLEDEPTTSPDPKLDTAKPIEIIEDEAPPQLTTLCKEADLQSACLSTHSKICILALLPADTPDTTANQALQSLAAIHNRHAKRGATFPFYGVSPDNALSARIRAELGLKEGLEIVATNAKRMWVRRYAGAAFGVGELGEWVDAIKMNEGRRDALPESLIKEVVEEEPRVMNAGPVVVEMVEEEEVEDAQETKEEKEKEHVIDEL